MSTRSARIEAALRDVLDRWKRDADDGDGIREEDMPVYQAACVALAEPGEERHGAGHRCTGDNDCKGCEEALAEPLPMEAFVPLTPEQVRAACEEHGIDPAAALERTYKRFPELRPKEPKEPPREEGGTLPIRRRAEGERRAYLQGYAAAIDAAAGEADKRVTGVPSPAVGDWDHAWSRCASVIASSIRALKPGGSDGK